MPLLSHIIFVQRKKANLLAVSFFYLSCLLVSINCYAVEQLSVSEQAQQKNKAKLTVIQREIAKQQSSIFSHNKKRAVLEKQLQKDDLAISTVAKALNDTEKKLTDTKVKITELSKRKQQLTSQKKHQEQLLAQQLRSAYTTGQHDYLKLLLNQEKSEKIQRTIGYYHYLNKARITEITQFQTTINKLLLITTQHQEHVDSLHVLKKQQRQHVITLKENKKQQQNTLAILSKKLLTSTQQLEKLQTEEDNLTLALQKLTEQIKSEINLTGLSQLKRKLSWPVKGRTLHKFGSRKQGDLTWKGFLLSAPIGRQVNAIHNGTVLFSDWLKGYGLLAVIDHGNGYMSLYAHNQTLLKSVGDRVETGEPIALVGQSGGQQQPGLYFEIRHKGKVVNPRLWCK